MKTTTYEARATYACRAKRLVSTEGPKIIMAMCFGSVEDTNAAWAEYEGSRMAVAAQGLRIERCKPKTKTAAESGVAEHVHNATQHTRAIAEAAAAEPVGAYGRRIYSGTDDRRHDARHRGSHLQALPQGQGPIPGVALALGLQSLVYLERFAIMPICRSYSCTARLTTHF
jgi:hypothetical protein